MVCAEWHPNISSLSASSNGSGKQLSDGRDASR